MGGMFECTSNDLSNLLSGLIAWRFNASSHFSVDKSVYASFVQMGLEWLDLQGWGQSQADRSQT